MNPRRATIDSSVEGGTPPSFSPHRATLLSKRDELSALLRSLECGLTVEHANEQMESSVNANTRETTAAQVRPVRAQLAEVNCALQRINLGCYGECECGEAISECYALQGPIHPQLNIAMDMGIVARTPSGAVLTLSLSFNNDGPLGSFFRYICDNGTYKAYYDDLVDGKDQKIDLSKVDVSMDGIELEDREFIAAIKEKREPNGSLAQVMPCMEALGKIEAIIDPRREAHA